MHVKKFFILFTFLTSTFAYTSSVLADGDHSNHSDVSNAITNFQGNGQQSSDEDSHSAMDHSENDEEQANMHNDDHSTVPESESGHSDSGHGEGHGDESVIEETLPNYKVLGTFGAINFGFLSLGVILKIRKRKESPYAVKSFIEKLSRK